MASTSDDEAVDLTEPSLSPPETDRSLALHEIVSLADTIRAQQTMHIYTKEAFRRDRIIGWAMTVIVFSLLGWVLFYQFVSVQDLRQRTYQACEQRNVQSAQQRALYDDLGAQLPPNSKMAKIITQSAKTIHLVDCTPLR
jgi:hypothetical protein